ncbi:hypothetical protein Adt_27160 [Abeliophyllum distichum]|uniref:Uncharacterized protein n=1 Tax=Abeliophyllum distichum TaxID=126358 RepID=A0ABD1RSY7_9LAMI
MAKIVGIPLYIDEATANLLRPSEARVCVEVNLEHKLPEQIWIDRVSGKWPTFYSFFHSSSIGPAPPSTSLPPLPTQTIFSQPITSTVTEITDMSKKSKGKEVVADQPQQ